MTIINYIKPNPNCVARITVRARKSKSRMKVNGKIHKVMAIFHKSS